MTVAPVSGPSTPASGRAHRRSAEWAVKLAIVCGGAFAVSVTTVGLAYALGAKSAVEDTLLGVVLFVVPAVGVLGSLVAFVLAAVAKARHEHWAWLWLPLGVPLAMIALVILSEAFLME